MEEVQQKNKVGRPTKWTALSLPIMQEYYQQCLKDPDIFPMVSELCIRLDITPETLNQWLDDVTKPLQFSDTYKKIYSLQQQRLIERGLDKRGSPAFEIFLLKANHNMRETSAIDLTSKDEKLDAGIFVTGGLKGDN